MRDYLEDFAGPVEQKSALQMLLKLAESSDSGSGPEGRMWTRDELYER